MSDNFSAYVELKKRKAVEQGKTWWFEASLTDEEAHLRFATHGEKATCNYCRYMRDTARHFSGHCLLSHSPSDILRSMCDEWRYFA